MADISPGNSLLKRVCVFVQIVLSFICDRKRAGIHWFYNDGSCDVNGRTKKNRRYVSRAKTGRSLGYFPSIADQRTLHVKTNAEGFATCNALKAISTQSDAGCYLKVCHKI